MRYYFSKTYVLHKFWRIFTLLKEVSYGIFITELMFYRGFVL